MSPYSLLVCFTLSVLCAYWASCDWLGQMILTATAQSGKGGSPLHNFLPLSVKKLSIVIRKVLVLRCLFYPSGCFSGHLLLLSLYISVVGILKLIGNI